MNTQPKAIKFAKILAVELRRLHEVNQLMLEALKLIANFPLEEFAQEKKPDTHLITRFNDWKFTVGDVRKARAALAKASGSATQTGKTE